MDERDLRTIAALTAGCALGPATLRRLAAGLSRQTLGRHRPIARSGRIWDAILYLERGAARSYALSADGEEKTYFLFFEGDWVCDLRSYADAAPSRFEFETLEECELVALPWRELRAAAAGDAALAGLLNQRLLAAYAALEQRMVDFFLSSPAERYAICAERHGPHLHRVPQYILAGYLGVQPESLSRIKRRLSAQSPDSAENRQNLNPDQ